MERPQLTSLLSNAVLDRLERRRIGARSHQTNRGRGEHLSGKGGTSTEFCDYRDYTPGDDTRFVDWNIFARLNRPYLKQFHREEERHVVLLVDASASMRFANKLTLARQLAAAFGVLGLRNIERVSVYTTDPARFLPPCRGRLNLRRLFAFLEQIESGGETTFDTAIGSLLRQHRGRGVCVVLSDFLTFGDMKRAFNSLYATGLEPLGIQILAPQEIEPEVAGDIRLQDAETQEGLDVSAAADLLALYQEYRTAYSRELLRACQRRAGRFVSISSAMPVESVLFDRLARQGWIE